MFIGLSMTDVNLMRWLGSRYDEVLADKLSQQRVAQRPLLKAGRAVARALERHYWIRTPRADHTQFISAHLERRGVLAYELPEWGKPFTDLMKRCFPA
ncbi:MAG: hypothetical protein MI673_07845 [Thiotrichales bacterium]|nr:hypothetical protein [Thiotrichales bacterium]